MINLILITALLISLVTDLYKRRIYNIVTLPCILFGLIYHVVNEGLSGLAFSLLGLFIGFLVLLIPFAMGGIGAGDVKLMAAIGACMGAMFVIKAFIYIAILGGVISLGILIKSYGLKSMYTSVLASFMLWRGKSTSALSMMNVNKIAFPYGIAIVLGTFLNFITH